jgi:competence protein ComEA
MSESLDEREQPPAPRRPPPDPGWRDRLHGLIHRAGIDLTPPRIAIAIVAVVAAVAGAILLLHPSSPPPPDDSLPRTSSVPALSTDATDATAPTTVDQLVVQAAGAVVHPGVYKVPADARVNDLVQIAGGFAPDADPDQVTLAATLTDGERVYVPRVGESVMPPPGTSGSNAPGSGSASPRGPVDLNHASEADLEALPGIGPALAQAIIDYRSQHGPFRSVDGLSDVRGIGPTKLEQLRPLVKV